MDTVEVIEADEITAENIAAILEDDFETFIDDDGELTIQVEDRDPMIDVTISEEMRYINFAVILPIDVDESVPMATKREIVNTLNTELMGIRFVVPESHPALLTMEYALPFDDCILVSQVVSLVRQLSLGAMHALSRIYSEGMLEHE